MSNITNPNDILIALAHLQDELPALVGEEQWNAIKSTFEARVAQLQQTSDPAEQERLSQDLLDMLASSEAASERLSNEIRSVAVLRHIMQEIDPQVTAMGFEADAVSKSSEVALRSISIEVEEVSEEDEATYRHIMIKWGGVDGTKSIKVRHLKLGLNQITKLLAETTLTGWAIISNLNPLIFSANILLMICTLTEAMTVRISETEASVFWGFIWARNEENMATEAQIMKQTNREREKRELEALTPKQVRRALYNLQSMKSVEKVAGQPKMWKMIENFNIRG